MQHGDDGYAIMTFDFATCNPDVGQEHNYYNEAYSRGANAMDLELSRVHR